MLTKLVHDYFGFNRQQRNGLLILCGLSVLLFCTRLFYPLFLPDPQIQECVVPFEKLPTENEAPLSLRSEQNYLTTRFDPNTAPAEAFEERGLNTRSARSLIKYRDKGFRFRKASDLQKIYGVSPEEYQRLQPLLLISEDGKKSNRNNFPAKKQIQKIEVNSADSTAWCSLPGIGPSFAKRIMKYRHNLGGFVHIEQLKEVYGLDETLFQKIQGFLSIDAGLIQKINVNTAEFKALVHHPYLGYEMTKLICNARRKSPFTAQSFCELPFIDDRCAQVMPYLRFEP